MVINVTNWSFKLYFNRAFNPALFGCKRSYPNVLISRSAV